MRMGLHVGSMTGVSGRIPRVVSRPRLGLMIVRNSEHFQHITCPLDLGFSVVWLHLHIITELGRNSLLPSFFPSLGSPSFFVVLDTSHRIMSPDYFILGQSQIPTSPYISC